MQVIFKRFVGMFSLLMCLGAVSVWHAHAQAAANATTATAAAQANAAAPVHIVIFSDFACPYSARLYFTLREFTKRNPGQLLVTYKQSPLTEVHPDAPLAHKAALAAGRQGKFDAMAELLYANQMRLGRASLLAYARQLHLDPIRFRHDLDSAEVAKLLAADMEESRAFGIDQTPTAYVAGQVLRGAQDEEALAAAVKQATARVLASAAPVGDPSGPALDAAIAAEIEHTPSAERGTARAPLTIVEFTDFQCPYCRAAVQPMEQFFAAHGREVHWVLHSFPLDFHPDSELANEAALAAGDQGNFWQMHDLLFQHQEALKLADLRGYAQQLGLDMRAFDQALADHRFAGKIAADRALGTRAGVSGTPTFFIDGKMMVGARSVPELEQMLAAHESGTPNPVVAAASPSTLPMPSRKVLGPSSGAGLTLTWYTDVRSPLATAQADLLHALANRYGDRLRVDVKLYPLETHADGKLAAAALLAAFAQDRFWPMYKALAAHREALDRQAIDALAKDAGVNMDLFAKAMNSADSSVQADVDEAQRRGILGAPVMFLNDKRVDGLQREAFYTAIADDELNTPRSTQASAGTSAALPGQ